jgi:hypothetical protein
LKIEIDFEIFGDVRNKRSEISIFFQKSFVLISGFLLEMSNLTAIFEVSLIVIPNSSPTPNHGQGKS